MRTRSARSYNPPTKWKGARSNDSDDDNTADKAKTRARSDDTVPTKRPYRKKSKMQKDNNNDTSTVDEKMTNDDDNIVELNVNNVNIHSDDDKKSDFDDKCSDDLNDDDVPTQGDEFIVNGEFMTNPVVVVNDEANEDLESLVESLQSQSLGTPRLTRFSTAASPRYVLRSGRTVGAQRSTMRHVKSKQTRRQQSVTPMGKPKPMRKKDNAKEGTPDPRGYIDETTTNEVDLKSDSVKFNAKKDLECASPIVNAYHRSTFPRRVAAKISTRTHSMNVKQLAISTTGLSSTYSYQKTVTVDQSINSENYEEELADLLGESMTVNEPKRCDSTIDLTQSESEADSTQAEDRSDDCIILSEDDNKDDRLHEEQPQDQFVDRIVDNDESQLEDIDEDLDDFPEDLPKLGTNNRNNRSMTVTSTAETTYHTAAQSLLSAPGDDSTLLDDLVIKMENDEQDDFGSSDIRETTSVDVVDDPFRQSYLSDDFSALSKIEQKSQAVQATLVEKRSFGTQTSEAAETGMQTIMENEKCSVGVQTDDVDLIRTWKYRCPTCSIYLDTAEEYRLHVAKYSSNDGCRRRRETLTPASSYLRRSYRHSGSFDIDNASFFTTDNEDTNASRGNLDALQKISENAKKSDESIDKSLMRSLLNVSDSVDAKESSGRISDISKNSRWSARFYDGNNASTIADKVENVSSTTTSTDAFTNSTLSSIAQPSVHNTIEEEQLCHFYEDTSARNQLLDLDSSHLSSISQEFDSELRSFMLEPQSGLKRNGRPVKNLRKHLKYFPPPIHQSSTRNSPRSIDGPNGGGSFLSSNEAEGNVAIYQFSSSESQEMEESGSRHQRPIFMYSPRGAKASASYKETKGVSPRSNAGRNEQPIIDNHSSFYTSTTARMSSCQRAALNQLNGAISALDSLISDGRAFERRFESFERSARDRMQSGESAGAQAVQPASPAVQPTKQTDVERQILSPLRGGIFKMKALIVKFENISARSEQALPAFNVKPKSVEKPIDEDNTKNTVDVAVGPDADEKEEEGAQEDKENHRQSTKLKGTETPKSANKIVDLGPKSLASSAAIDLSPEGSTAASSAKKNITIKRDSRNVNIGRNRRSGLVTPVQSPSSSWDDEDDNKKYATTPRTTREVLAHLKVRHPLDDLSDDEGDDVNDQDDSNELIESIIRSRNAFIPLPSPMAACRFCGVHLAGQPALNLHYVRYHIDELAKCVDAAGTKNGCEDEDDIASIERRVTSVDSGNVSGRGQTPANPIYEEDEELSFLVESGDGSRLDRKTPLPTLDEMEVFDSDELPRRRSPARRLFQSIDSADGPKTADGDGGKTSSGIASAASGDVSVTSPSSDANPPSSFGDSSKSSWMRWANLEDGKGPILNVNRYKVQLFNQNQSAQEGIRRISFQSFSSENNSSTSSRNVSGNVTVFSDDHSESCEDTSATSSIQYRAGRGSVANSPAIAANSPTLDRTQSSVADDEQSFHSAAGQPADRSPSAPPAEGTPLMRLAPPRFITPYNQPSTPVVNDVSSSSYMSLAVTPMTSKASKSPMASPLDAMFDISSRVERFNRCTPLPSPADGVEEVDEQERKQRRRTGYDAKTTPSVREMVSLIHSNASTSKLLGDRRKCDKGHGFGTPLTHTFNLTGRRAKAFNLWRANTGERIYSDDFIDAMAVNQVARRLAAKADEPPPPDGLQFVMSFESAFRAVEFRKARNAALQAKAAAAMASN